MPPVLEGNQLRLNGDAGSQLVSNHAHQVSNQIHDHVVSDNKEDHVMSNENNGVMTQQNGHVVGNGHVGNWEESREVNFTKIKQRNDAAEHNEGVVSIRYHHRHFYTVTKHDVPLLFREAHVDTGFRPLHKPWSFYLKSIFYLHNECMNVWTHLIAFVLTSLQLHQYSYELDFVNDPYTWPMLAGLICGIALYLCSSLAHCCQSKSELVHYVAFMIDYAGIGLYGLGSVIVHLQYCCEEDFYNAVQRFYIPLGGTIAFLICYCCTIAKVTYSRPYPFARKLWQITPVMCIYVVLISPIVHRLHACFVHGIDCTESVPYHVQQIIWFFISGFFFASDIPQRWYPSKFDIFLHSHQLFHIAIAICTLVQMHGVLVDFHTRQAFIRARPEPTLMSAFGPVVFVVAMEAACIIYFAVRIARRLKEVNKKKE